MLNFERDGTLPAPVLNNDPLIPRTRISTVGAIKGMKTIEVKPGKFEYNTHV